MAHFGDKGENAVVDVKEIYQLSINTPGKNPL